MNITLIKNKHLTDKLLVIFCTGMPGIQRVIMFIVVERLYTLNELGDFSSDMSIVQLISFFTAVSWASLAMTKIPKIANKEQYLFRLLTTSCIYYVFFALVLYVMHTSGLIKDISASLLFLFAWMIYQIHRHFNVALRKYKNILVIDTLCIITAVLMLFIEVTPLIAIGFSYLLISILFIPSIYKQTFKIIAISDQIKAVEVGLSTFLLGASTFGLPFICGLVIHIEYSALLGFAISFLSMMHLIPRAISLYFIPKMSKMVSENDYRFIQESLRQFIFNTISMFFISILLMAIIYLIHLYRSPPLTNIDNSLYIMYLLLAKVILTAFSLPATDFFLSIEKTKPNLNSSYLHSIITIISVLAFLKFGHNSDDIIYLLIMLCIAGVFRNIYLYTIVLKHRKYYISNMGKAINDFK